MRLFKYKGILLPSSSSEPIKLKRIGKEVFHHMSIYVKDCLWYANDGAHYLHERHVKRKIPFGTSSSLIQEVRAEPGSKPQTEPTPQSEAGPSSVKQQPSVSEVEKTGLETMSHVDSEQLRSVMREIMKDELSNLVKKAIQDEISSIPRSDMKKVEEMESEVTKSAKTISDIKKDCEKMLTELHHYRILYDEFSARVKKDLNNNVIGFDNFVSQVKKIGDFVSNAFKTMDTKTDKTSHAVTNLQ